MSTQRDQEFYEITVLATDSGTVALSDLLTSEIVKLQLLCDAELQERADYYPDDDGGNNGQPSDA